MDAVPVIAIVDDDASVRRSLLRVVRSAGYTAEAFASAGGPASAPAPSARLPSDTAQRNAANRPSTSFWRSRKSLPFG